MHAGIHTAQVHCRHIRTTHQPDIYEYCKPYVAAAGPLDPAAPLCRPGLMFSTTRAYQSAPTFFMAVCLNDQGWMRQGKGPTRHTACTYRGHETHAAGPRKGHAPT